MKVIDSSIRVHSWMSILLSLTGWFPSRQGATQSALMLSILDKAFKVELLKEGR